MIPVLAGYRLRPVPWAWLAGLAVGWLLLTRAVAAAAPDPGVRVGVLRWAAATLGLGASLLAAPETDPPRDMLRPAPVPSWRALALRLASMPGDPRWPSSLAWTVGLSLAIVAAALALEARGGTRAGLPGRRHAARRWRAAELEVRP